MKQAPELGVESYSQGQYHQKGDDPVLGHRRSVSWGGGGFNQTEVNTFWCSGNRNPTVTKWHWRCAPETHRKFGVRKGKDEVRSGTI